MPAWYAPTGYSGSYIDWPRWLGSGIPIDPYLVWADLSGFAGFGGPAAARGRWPIAMELSRAGFEVPDGNVSQCVVPTASCPAEFGLFDITGAYKIKISNVPLATLETPFVTARILPCNVETLLRCGTGVVKRFQLGIPRIPGTEQAVRIAPPGTRIGREQVVVGVIDDGFAFAHDQFLDHRGQPRTCYLWDQDASRTPDPPLPGGWKSLADFGYGGERYRGDLTAAITQSADDASPRAATQPYDAIDYVPHAPDPESHATGTAATPCTLKVPAGTMLRAAHGTSVMDLACGNVPVLGVVDRNQGQIVPTTEDSAPAWPIVLVQLPTRTALDTSGGSLAVHVLDGLRYIVLRAKSIPLRAAPDAPTPQFSLPTDPVPSGDGRKVIPNPVVINLSYGAIGGPHDGTSIVEKAIDHLVRKEGKMAWVVLSAGNAHGSQTHVRLELLPGGAPKHLTWTVGADNVLESYLEIWLPHRNSLGAPLNHKALLNGLQITVFPPEQPALRVQPCSAALLGEAGQPPVAACIYAQRVAQGENGTMVLLTVAATRRPLAAEATGQCPPAVAVPAAPYGDWTIEMSLLRSAAPPDSPVVMHAWAERNDLIWGTERRQQSFVAGDDPVPPPTEFAVTVQDFVAKHVGRVHTDDVPRPFQPDTTLGSLASLAPDNPKFADWLALPLGERPALNENDRGPALVVGATRWCDGEVAGYSSAGPARGSLADGGRLPGGDGHLPPPEDPAHVRLRPDISAPSDAGSALRGLRTAGMRNASVSRLSGTSAAAPLVARLVANTLFEEIAKVPAYPGGRPGLVATAADTTPYGARPIPTPTNDDRFRRGRYTLVPPVKEPDRQ